MLRRTLLVVLVAAVAGVAASAAGATAPQPLTITMDGTLTGPSSIVGTWRAGGLFEASGTYREEFAFAGHSIHDTKWLTSPQGTIVLRVQTVFDAAPDGMVTFRAGSWQVVEATGAYAGLHAGGQPFGAAESFGSLATSQVHIRHEGSGHFE